MTSATRFAGGADSSSPDTAGDSWRTHGGPGPGSATHTRARKVEPAVRPRLAHRQDALQQREGRQQQRPLDAVLRLRSQRHHDGGRAARTRQQAAARREVGFRIGLYIYTSASSRAASRTLQWRQYQGAHCSAPSANPPATGMRQTTCAVGMPALISWRQQRAACSCCRKLLRLLPCACPAPCSGLRRASPEAAGCWAAPRPAGCLSAWTP